MSVINSLYTSFSSHDQSITTAVGIIMLITLIGWYRYCATLRKGSILSDSEILAELGRDVIIEPFNRPQLGPNSYDVTLGAYYFEPQLKSLPTYFHAENPSHTIKYWGVNNKMGFGSKRAMLIVTLDEAEKYGVNIDDEIIIIPPGHVILGHTNEFIGGRHHITTSLHSRSTMGRSCMSICKCSGFGDIGYVNRYTLEIENHGLVPAVLKVGQRVGQIAFHRTGDVLVSYEKRGQYQITSNIKKLIATWNPLCMIPGKAAKLIKDQLAAE